jgi:integrase
MTVSLGMQAGSVKGFAGWAGASGERISNPQPNPQNAMSYTTSAKVLSELRQPEYELALLVATCGLRISEALGLRWRDILWDRGLIAIRQTSRPFQHAEWR